MVKYFWLRNRAGICFACSFVHLVGLLSMMFMYSFSHVVQSILISAIEFPRCVFISTIIISYSFCKQRQATTRAHELCELYSSFNLWHLQGCRISEFYNLFPLAWIFAGQGRKWPQVRVVAVYKTPPFLQDFWISSRTQHHLLEVWCFWLTNLFWAWVFEKLLWAVG